ncbi:MAG: hypothetical protein K2L14_05075 [Duncaniella sp.]|nr:hypothetical protein [Duncaniella sp.]
MIKKLLALLIAVISLNASAQLAVGSWRLFPVFGPKVSKIVDSKDRVYYINSGFLYGYDKEADGAIAYDRSNILSDVNVTGIFYNHAAKYLAIAYGNGNIDLLYDNDEVVNLPDIKDATLSIPPVINDIVFDGDNMYVAANFGLVHYDTKRHEVRESGVFNKDISKIILFPDYYVILSGKKLYSMPRSSKFNKFENFKAGADDNVGCTSFVVMDSENGMFGGSEMSVVKKFQLDLTTGEVKQTGNYIGAGSNVTTLKDCGDKVYFANASGIIYSLARPLGNWTNEGTVPAAFGSDLFDTCKGLDEVWVAGKSGIAEWNIADKDNHKVLRDRYKPTPSTTVDIPAHIIPSADGNAFYTTNLGRSNFRLGGQGEGITLVQLADKYEDGEFVSVAAENVSARHIGSINTQKVNGPVLVNPTYILEDPDDSSILYMSSGTEGVYVVKDGQEIMKFDWENSPLPDLAGSGSRVVRMEFDKAGNLWVACHALDKYLFVLPAAKRKNIKSVTSSDWVNATEFEMTSFKDITIVPLKKSNMVLVQPSKSMLLAIDTRGTDSNFTDDKSYLLTSFTDQDGKNFDLTFASCMVEDHDGKVWIGTFEGVVEITNPATFASPDFRINHLKVPRNDGTNLADYLLEKENITSISVDNSNRKWVGTANSGVYLVSPSGDEILGHYTAENSMLPSNSVYAIYAHPTSNSVFMATPFGIAEYSSDSSPARPDYSDVYAYPNPVTPDYTGWITITGLMADSRIKICDSAMNVVAETASEGGMAMWDGCNFSGARVKSGVYYVLASTKADSAASAADVVAKILVVN